MPRKKIIIGITGTNGAGKGTVVDYLVKGKNFSHFSASGLIRDEIIKRKMHVNRDNMIIVGNDLRAKNGAGYIAEELIKRALNNKNNSVIESIRTLSEIDILRKKGGILLAVDADQELRYKRIFLRGGEKDRVTFEEFMDQEKREMESGDPNKQNLLVCIKVADYLIKNESTFEELNKEIEKLLVKIKSNGK